jgi:leucyl aminopeptidase (aminopeptidase T)
MVERGNKSCCVKNEILGEIMSRDKAILDALKINLGYKEGERVGIVVQKWCEAMGEDRKLQFEETEALCKEINRVFVENGITSKLIEYTPSEARNGADATKELYDKTNNVEVLFMPVVFSLTHTPYRKTQTAKGIRIASMPGFTIDMFDKGGPMAVDYELIHKKTTEIANLLKSGKYVKVEADGTNMVVEVMTETAHVSSGMLNKQGAYGNLPGAEAYIVPTHCGNSNGFFTVPANWGGNRPIKFKAKFFVKQGRIVDIQGETDEANKYIEQEVKPLVFGGEDFNILAELGIGTNPNITENYIKNHGWSTLTAEKIYGSAHFANGNSFGMGGANNVPVHIDWVVPNVTITYNYKVEQ